MLDLGVAATVVGTRHEHALDQLKAGLRRFILSGVD
jgi:hypothetical protein